MKTLAHQIEPVSCGSTLTFAQFSALRSSDLDGFVADQKFDGRRYLVQMRPNKAFHNYVTSRRIGVNGLFSEKQDSLPSFKLAIFGPDDTVYDGEMYDPRGGTSHEAATAVAQDFAHYAVFDLLRLEGTDLRGCSQADRWAELRKLSRYFLPRMHLVRHSSKPKALLSAVRAIDGEGIILKLPEHVGYDGKGWVKVVAEEFFDCVVVGFSMSESERYGSKHWIRGVEIGQWFDEDYGQKLCSEYNFKVVARDDKRKRYLLHLGSISGFTEMERARITRERKNMLGTVVVVRAKGREVTTAFRHPRFDRWRDDKDPYACVFTPPAGHFLRLK